jgi:hypothetical protein
MAITIGHKGWLDLLSNKAGPKRKPVRIAQVVGDTGTFTVTNIGITNDAHLVGVVNVTTGAPGDSLATWTEAGTQGSIDHADTGTTTNIANGDVLFLILSDTGPQTSA